MPLPAAVKDVVAGLHVEVTTVSNDLRCVVIKMCRVVERWLTPTVIGRVRLIPISPLQLSCRTINVRTMSVTLSPTMPVLSLCFATEGKRERDSKSDGRHKHFLIQHG